MSLFKQITEKPWERKGIIGGLKAEGTFDAPSERVALTFFLIAASIVFSLFGVSYYIRMELPDWLPIAEPTDRRSSLGGDAELDLDVAAAREAAEKAAANGDSPRDEL